MSSCQPFCSPPPTLPSVTIFDYLIFEMFEFLKSLSLLLCLLQRFQKFKHFKNQKMVPGRKRGVDIRPAHPRTAKSPRSATRPCNRHTGLGCPYVHLAISNISKMNKRVVSVLGEVLTCVPVEDGRVHILVSLSYSARSIIRTIWLQSRAS